MTIDYLIELAIREDLGDGDHTSLATIPASAKGKASLMIKETGILAGMDIAEKVFSKIDPAIIFKPLLSEGTNIKRGDVAFIVEGNVISLLSAERLALNFMQRMSGIATYTDKLASLIEGLDAKLLDTRKTTPLLREIEKMAVRIGGGYNHRFGLFDMIMIKDNHIDFAGGIRQAIDSTTIYLKKTNKKLKIEIEVRNFKELSEVLETGGINRIMLDNFSPQEIEKAIELINGAYETEASGGITLENIRAYAETGVDYISVGALTHQIKSLDMSLKAV
ncbi:MAG: carboxylating nicotinate-nucleotide diphosphorylase [Bacteroidales bacterium]|nr:carboxylating nicotinate-nucleotide diphosphorylase [Bacteroidales bacterium]